LKGWGRGRGGGGRELCIIHIYRAVFIASDYLAEYTNTDLLKCFPRAEYRRTGRQTGRRSVFERQTGGEEMRG
jgi:hypothetical protein